MLGNRFSRATAVLCAAVFATLLGGDARSADQLDLPDLIAKVKPSVVRIDVKGADGGGIGSGFVVDADGIVVTNHHVIAGAQEAVAVFSNNETAKVLGTYMLDKKRDIAILQIDKKGLAVLKLAEKVPREGESVIACGAPRGLSFSSTNGIISAIRSGKEFNEFVGEEKPGTWLQTDTPISPGNSGGPLINRSGEVVGANTLGSTAFGGQNLNFSISSVDIAEVLNKGRKTKLVALSDGAAKSKHEHPKPKKNDLAAEKIPKEKIESYVKNAKGSFKDAILDARKELTDTKRKLTDMKSGTMGPLAAQAGRMVVKLIKGRQFYEYPDQKTKNEELRKQQEEVRKAEEHFTKIQDPSTGMLTYLMKAGPIVELKEVGDVGCVSEIFVTTILDDDEFLAHLDDKLPVAVRGMKAKSVASGHALSGRLMYVCAMDTYSSQNGGVNIRVLREMPEDDFAKHLEALGLGTDAQAKTDGKSGPTEKATGKVSEPQYRLWTDKSGKYKIEAILIEKTADTVKLKRKDTGQEITLPISKLSQTDLDHIKTLPNVKSK
jgi:S1-C subfamily serine protease